MADSDKAEQGWQDWRDECKTICEILAKARQKELLVDVRFLVGREAPNARVFSAHKIILACGSPVFEAMFEQLAENQDPIPIPEDDPQGFEIMLRYLYGETVCFPSIVVACKAYFIADKYVIPQLLEISANFIALNGMDDASFWSIIEERLLDCKSAEENFRKYIQVHATRLLKSDKSLKLPEDIVEMILHMDQIDITEFELLSFTTRWGSKRFTKDASWKLKALLQNIRFSTLKPQEFSRFHESFPDVLDSDTCLTIMKHLNDPNTYRLPDWCSTNKTKRNEMNAESGSSVECIGYKLARNIANNRAAITGRYVTFGSDNSVRGEVANERHFEQVFKRMAP